jgi:superkiller protein 3
MWRLILVVILLPALLGCGGDQSEEYLQAGFAYFQQQDFDKAIQNYEKAIALGTKSAGAYNFLGMSYRFKFQQTGKPELQQNEIDAYQKAINLDPNYWVAMVNLGTTYYSRGEKAQAAVWFKKAMALNPDYPERARIEKMIAEKAKSSEVLKPAGKSAMPLLPEGRDSAAVEKYLQEGIAHIKKQEYDEAIKDCKKAIELDPKNSSAYNMLDMVYNLKYSQVASQNAAKRRSQKRSR